MSGLTHFDGKGDAQMVDVSDKEVTDRISVAACHVRMMRETFDIIAEGRAKKGDVLAVARLAGIMGAKKTADLIPLCHPLPITKVFIEEGRNHLFTGQMFDPGRPIVVLQGLLDKDVPAEHTRRMSEVINPDCIELVEVPDGEHRMSRPEDLELLYKAVKKVA